MYHGAKITFIIVNPNNNKSNSCLMIHPPNKQIINIYFYCFGPCNKVWPTTPKRTHLHLPVETLSNMGHLKLKI